MAEQLENTDKPGGTDTIVVVGAGIVGVSTALWLKRDGHNVVLMDREGPAAGASYGNGAVLARCSVVPITMPGLLSQIPGMLLDRNSPLFMRWRYLPKLLPWLVRYMAHCTTSEVKRISAALTPIVADSLDQHFALARGTEAEKFIKPSDYLFLYKDRATAMSSPLALELRSAAVGEPEILEHEALRAYDPAFSSDIGCALRYPDHGYIEDPGGYVTALAKVFEELGGRFIKSELVDFVIENGTLTALVTKSGNISCKNCVLSTGAWSKPFMKKLGLDVPLETERGYHLELINPNIVPRAPVMVASGRFVITPLKGRLRLAGVVEFGGLDAPASKAPIELLRTQVRAAIPGLTWESEREWLGHRPAPSDSIPLLGPVPNVKGAYAAFGHHHIGLTGGPKSGRMIADLISGKHSNLDMGVYAPARFAR